MNHAGKGFKSTGHIQVVLDDSSPLSLNYTSYVPLQHTKNALTLEQLSVDLLTLPTNNQGQESHFQTVFQSYVDYYGSADYGNKWIQAAFQQITTNMNNGNASFSIFSNPQDVNGTYAMSLWLLPNPQPSCVCLVATMIPHKAPSHVHVLVTPAVPVSCFSGHFPRYPHHECMDARWSYHGQCPSKMPIFFRWYCR